MASGERSEDREYIYKDAAESEASRLLDNVLDLTEQGDESDVDESLLRLAMVAQKNGEEIVSLQGLTELVRESLRDYAQSARLSEQTRKNLSVQVAKALFDDPSAKERLDRLWKRITEIRI